VGEAVEEGERGDEEGNGVGEEEEEGEWGDEERNAVVEEEEEGEWGEVRTDKNTNLCQTKVSSQNGYFAFSSF
jgi:hypothetical protein